MLSQKIKMCFSLIQQLKQRNILFQSTAPEIPQPKRLLPISELIYGKQLTLSQLEDYTLSVYCGFDPTAKSLHLGNLFQILTLARIAKFGYNPIALVGGATAMLGDPSGRKTDREFQQNEIIQQQAQRIQTQIDKIWKNIPNSPPQLTIVNNYDFYKSMKLIDFMAQDGRLFRMNSLLAKEHIQQRVNSPTGLSFTEFFYTLLQSYDYRELVKRYNCIIQLGGSDQWGNITNGCDFVKKSCNQTVYGITTKLLLTKNGEKFGKSQGNAIWLDEELTSKADLHQYLINQTDEDIINQLKMFTYLTDQEIEQIEIQQKQNPESRIGQKRLSQELISIIHGGQTTASKLFSMNFIELKQQSEDAQRHFFSSEQKWDQLYEIKPADLEQFKSMTSLLVHFMIKKSNSEVKRSCQAGGLYINDKRVDWESIQNFKELWQKESFFNTYLVVRFGKKNYSLIKLKTS